MKSKGIHKFAEHTALIVAVMNKSAVPLGPSAIARQLENDGTHWWDFSPNCRMLVRNILQSIKAVKHPGGKYTSPLPTT